MGSRFTPVVNFTPGFDRLTPFRLFMVRIPLNGGIPCCEYFCFCFSRSGPCLVPLRLLECLQPWIAANPLVPNSVNWSMTGLRRTGIRTVTGRGCKTAESAMTGSATRGPKSHLCEEMSKTDQAAQFTGLSLKGIGRDGSCQWAPLFKTTVKLMMVHCGDFASEPSGENFPSNQQVTRGWAMSEPDLNESLFDGGDLRPALLDSVRVSKTEEGRTVVCFCGDQVKRSIVPHMKRQHKEEWNQWVETFIELRSKGLSLKNIMHLFRSSNDLLLFSWTVVDRAIRALVETGQIEYVPPPIPSVRAWEPIDFQLETSTIWDFPIRGAWAVHIGDYRGNWPPQLARNIILKYTRPGDLVVDAFMGGGTTLIEAWLLNRRSVGIDVSKLAYQTASARLERMQILSEQDSRVKIEPKYKPHLVLGDSTFTRSSASYSVIQPNSVNLLCVHPPYLNALTYTNGEPADLSIIKDPQEFAARIVAFAKGTTAYLTPDGVCAVLIGDVRRNGRIIPLGALTLCTFLNVGFQLDEIVVKTQHRDRSSEFYFSSANGYLLAHEYLYIFRWPPQDVTKIC